MNSLLINVRHENKTDCIIYNEDVYKRQKQDGMNNLDLKSIASSCRKKMISLYQKLGFSGDELAVLSALTIGDKTELSDSVRESYSVAGASHILALSGLHIGLLYTLLFFILKPIARRGNIGSCLLYTSRCV